MVWPTITAIAGELRLRNANVEGEFRVWLIVWPRGEWIVTDRGTPDDPNYAGIGAADLPGVGGRNMQPQRFNAREVARDLLQQAKGSGGGGSEGGRRGGGPTRKPLDLLARWGEGRSHEIHSDSRPTQPGTDDYQPETQLFYPQVPPRELQGFTGQWPTRKDIYEPLPAEPARWQSRRPEPIGKWGCPRCGAELTRGEQNCAACAREGVFVSAVPRTWENPEEHPRYRQPIQRTWESLEAHPWMTGSVTPVPLAPRRRRRSRR